MSGLVQGDTSPSVVIEKLGFGPVQICCFVVSIGIWLLTGFQTQLLSVIVWSVSEDLEVHRTQQSLVMSLFFAGLMIGNLLGGPVADFFGRRPPLVVAFGCSAAFTYGCSYAPNFAILCLLCLLNGVFIGLGQPACQANIVEIAPSTLRVPLIAAAMMSSGVGSALSSVLARFDDQSVQGLHWRWLFGVSSILPVVFFVLAFAFLHESPTYLWVKSRDVEAQHVLESFRTTHNAQIQIELTPYEDARGQTPSFVSLWSQRLYVRLAATIGFACFAMAFGVGGVIYAFPQILAQFHLPTSPTFTLFLGTGFQILGALIAGFLGMYVPRKAASMCALLVFAFASVVFALGAQENSLTTTWEVYSTFAIFKVCGELGQSSLFAYASEAFPAAIRATGVAMCACLGKAGFIAAFSSYEMLNSSDHVVFFFLLAGVMAVSAIPLSLLTSEAVDQVLDDCTENNESDALKAGARKIGAEYNSMKG